MNIDFLLNLTSLDVVLTPNQRLTHTLQHELEKHYADRGRKAFAPPLLLSFSQFIRTLWKAYIFISPKKLLSKNEEAWLWRHIINNSHISKELLNTQQTASLVQSAWHNLTQWDFRLENIHDYLGDNENLIYFYTWAQHFINTCSQRDFIDESSALLAYANNTSFIENLPYQRFYFYHFIDTTPLQEKFIYTLRQSKDVVILNQNAINRSLQRLEIDSASEELLTMAQWAQDIYIKNPKARIGCVIPALHEKRDEAERIFKKIFNPQHPPIDISAGYLLSDFVVIQHMLLLIQLQEEYFDYELFSTYLRSAYFNNSESEINSRCILDAALRELCTKTTSLKKIDYALSSLNNLTEKKILTASHINCFSLPAITATSESKKLNQWCQQWLDFIKQLGWPGQRNLNSTEYQVVQRFITLLNDLDEFDSLQTSWTWREFSSLLKIQCQQTVFQTQTEKTSIQLLGLLEASGMTFDALWITGLDDKTWPSTASPNPFLPYILQKKHQFPHASAEREYLFCKELLEQLIQASPEVILSHAKHDNDKERRPSPLISHISAETPTCAWSASTQMPKPNPTIEILMDNTAPAVNQNEQIRGGTSIVQEQALCPFKAFAHIRLHAKAMPELTDTPNALMRGNKVHRSLELLWKKIKNSTRLCQLSDTELKQHIEHAVTIAHDESPYPDPFFTSLEKIRLNKVLHQWMTLEKKRETFSVIATEEAREYQYKNITLRMRVDRIDETEDGNHVIIDYKTGSPNIQHWLGSRIKEPQLPLYCISHPTTVNTLLFAQIRWNDFSIKGLTNDDNKLDTVTQFDELPIDIRAPSWQEQKIYWKNSIDYLLEEFLQGNAEIKPLDQTTCTHCDLHGLCRIFEYDN